MANAAWLGLGLDSVWPITYCEDHSHLMSFEFLNSLETETLTAMCWCALVHQLGIEKINMIVQWHRDTSMISSKMTVLFLSVCIFPMCRLDHILCLDNRSKNAFWLDSMIFIGANCWMPRHAISRCQEEGRSNTLFSSIAFTLQSTPANAGNIFVPILQCPLVHCIVASQNPRLHRGCRDAFLGTALTYSWISTKHRDRARLHT